MKPLLVRSAVLAAGLLAGCASSTYDPELHGIDNMWVGASLQQKSAELAIVRQGAILEYYFVSGTAELTPLGRRDLEVLARHFQERPGAVSVRRGAASEALYDARLDSVRIAFAAAGVDLEQLQLGDEPLGGDGIASANVRLALEADRTFTATGNGSIVTGGGVIGGGR